MACSRYWRYNPYAAALLLGDLGVFSQAWRGWRIVDEEIIAPDGLAY